MCIKTVQRRRVAHTVQVRAQAMATGGVTALITGANRGLGLEMVKQMAECEKGAARKVFACCRDPDGAGAKALHALAKKHPDVITIVQLDATDLSSIQECARKVGAQLGCGGLNLLVNNAGVMFKEGILDCKAEDMLQAFNTNVTGPLNIMREFLPQLRAAVKASDIPGMSCKKAAVVNISTSLGSLHFVKETLAVFGATALPYRASKAALNMVTACAAEELKQEGILFSLLHPGWVRTDMGGEGGMIDSPESVQGMLKVMASLTEKETGSFLDHQGQVIPW